MRVALGFMCFLFIGSSAFGQMTERSGPPVSPPDTTLRQTTPIGPVSEERDPLQINFDESGRRDSGTSSSAQPLNPAPAQVVSGCQQKLREGTGFANVDFTKACTLLLDHSACRGTESAVTECFNRNLNRHTTLRSLIDAIDSAVKRHGRPEVTREIEREIDNDIQRSLRAQGKSICSLESLHEEASGSTPARVRLAVMKEVGEAEPVYLPASSSLRRRSSTDLAANVYTRQVTRSMRDCDYVRGAFYKREGGGRNARCTFHLPSQTDGVPYINLFTTTVGEIPPRSSQPRQSAGPSSQSDSPEVINRVAMERQRDRRAQNQNLHNTYRFDELSTLARELSGNFCQSDLDELGKSCVLNIGPDLITSIAYRYTEGRSTAQEIINSSDPSFRVDEYPSLLRHLCQVGGTYGDRCPDGINSIIESTPTFIPEAGSESARLVAETGNFLSPVPLSAERLRAKCRSLPTDESRRRRRGRSTAAPVR